MHANNNNSAARMAKNPPRVPFHSIRFKHLKCSYSFSFHLSFVQIYFCCCYRFLWKWKWPSIFYLAPRISSLQIIKWVLLYFLIFFCSSSFPIEKQHFVPWSKGILHLILCMCHTEQLLFTNPCAYNVKEQKSKHQMWLVWEKNRQCKHSKLHKYMDLWTNRTQINVVLIVVVVVVVVVVTMFSEWRRR